jgi:hypothetical protein
MGSGGEGAAWENSSGDRLPLPAPWPMHALIGPSAWGLSFPLC